jgi:adenylate kinase family enzyme
MIAQKVKLAILRNSGSGKSTLAKSLAAQIIPLLDLDSIVWEPNRVAVPRLPQNVLKDL